MEAVDRFFVLDFDRCLGNIDANLALLDEITQNLSNFKHGSIRIPHDVTRAGGKPFLIFEYFRIHYPDIDIDILCDAYIKLAWSRPGCLLNSGADELLRFLIQKKYDFCIMSFGDKLWQETKITAAGLGDIPKLIVSSEGKGRRIAGWFDDSNETFAIPGVCYADGASRLAKNLILIDDKIIAFDGLPTAARGYLVQDKNLQSLGLPQSIKHVNNLQEIIRLEL
jgi:hypothetical protein